MTRGLALTRPLAGSLDARDFEVAIHSDLFTGISPPLLELILPRTRMIRLDPREVLIERGAPNDFVFLILEGSLHVHLDNDNVPSFVLGPGTCAGEISVIDGRGASARVLAAEPTRLLSIDGKTLWYLVANTEAAARNLLLIFSGRMRRDNDLLLARLRERQAFGRIASVDGLTGLHNRRWMESMFARQMKRCARNRWVACLILVDVDRFQAFNTRYGPIKADQVLQQIASLLAARIRPSDLLARHEADAFAILLPSTALGQAASIAERLRLAVAPEALARDGPGEIAEPVTVSIGVVEMTMDDSLARLVGKAGAALQQAKAAGGNAIRSASS